MKSCVKTKGRCLKTTFQLGRTCNSNRHVKKSSTSIAIRIATVKTKCKKEITAIRAMATGCVVAITQRGSPSYNNSSYNCSSNNFNNDSRRNKSHHKTSVETVSVPTTLYKHFIVFTISVCYFDRLVPLLRSLISITTTLALIVPVCWRL